MNNYYYDTEPNKMFYDVYILFERKTIPPSINRKKK